MSENKPNSPLPENQINENPISENIASNNPLPAPEKNSIINEALPEEKLKKGQYYLTPLQSIIINKKFPHGFKLETEENILKSMEMIKAQEKRHKQNIKNNNQQISRRTAYNKSNTNNSKNKYNTNTEKIPNNIPQEKIKINKQCLAGFDKLKESKFFQRFNFPYEPGAPCLSAVEKKILNYEYNTLYEFEMDVRNIWNFFFKMNYNDEMAKKMSEDWEKICTELENPNAEINNNLNVKDIKKRIDKIGEDLEKYRDNKGELPPPPVKKNNQNNEHNKPMTVEEKNRLGNDIRNLNKEQLKGIIMILNESDSYPKTKYFEFDIDKLSNKKLRELEKYVKDCINLNRKNQAQNQNQNTQQHNANNNNKTQNINQNKNNNNINNNNIPQSNTKNKENNKKEETNNKDMTPGKKKQNTSVKKTDKKNDSSSDSLSSDSDSSISN